MLFLPLDRLSLQFLSLLLVTASTNAFFLCLHVTPQFFSFYSVYVLDSLFWKSPATVWCVVGGKARRGDTT